MKGKYYLVIWVKKVKAHVFVWEDRKSAVLLFRSAPEIHANIVSYFSQYNV